MSERGRDESSKMRQGSRWANEFSMQDEAPVYHPEHGLLAAILERAIRDCLGTDIGASAPRAHEKRQALYWIKSDATCEWSFRWVCDHIDMGASMQNWIRAAVMSEEAKKIVRSQMERGNKLRVVA